MELLLIRHGRVADGGRAFNEAGRYDQGLGDIGREQAERVVDRLAEKDIDAIYVSGLKRTSETAAPLAAERGIEPVMVDALSEVYLGEYEGRSFAQMLKDEEPVYMKFIEERRWETFPGAESDAALRKRVAGAVDEIADAHPNGCAAVFTHGGIINAALAIAIESPRLVIISPENASVTSIFMRPRPPLVVTVNDASHLGSERDPLRRRPVYGPKA